jgi:murein DD-endopeptidase MepM/ murein hydrolase activator NlpD
VPAVEELENRRTPTITLTNAFLVDVNDVALSAPPDKGESVSVEADWTTQGLPSNASYRVLVSVDGITLNSDPLSWGAGVAQSQSWSWFVGSWFAAPGTHNVSVTIDPTTYGSTSKSFNFTPVSAPDLPHKFITPLGGTPMKDWGVTEYVDVDPRSSFADYTGGSLTYDGHTGHDLAPANLGWMDAGLPVFAAAAGKVVAVADGNYDRNIVATDVPANYVEIDHGNGWHTLYYHLRSDTILVHVGDTVVAGQVLGLMGSSGYSAGAHLHFEVQHNGAVVEPEYDPNTFWVNPLPYQGTVSAVTDSGVTSSHAVLTTDLNAEERPVAANVFSQASGQELTAWFQAFTRATDQAEFKFYEPDGTPYTSLDDSFSPGASLEAYFYYDITLPANLPLGTWHVGIVLNGTEMARDSFQVTAGGAGSAHVSQGSTYVPNGRTTPIDFGTVSQGSAPPQLSFTISNLGSATLALSNLVLPSGFSLVSTFPSSIPVGGSATIKIQMSTSTAGTAAGMVQFSTNDPNVTAYNFDVKGTVSGGNTGEIHGQVFDDINGDGIENSSDGGLVGWTVSLINPASNAVLASTTTGYNGYYAFFNLAAGTYRVRQNPPPGWSQTNPNPADVSVGSSDVLASPFGVGTNLAASLLVSAPMKATVGTAFTITVTARDTLGNIATGYSGVVHFSSSAAGAILPSDATLTNGTGVFRVTFPAIGNFTVTARDTVTASITGGASVASIPGPVLVAQLGTQGLWEYTSTTGDKVQLTAANASLLVADSTGDLAAEFNGYGIWQYRAASGWQQLTRSDASLLVMDAQGDVTGEFLNYGVWQFVAGAGWKQLTPADATLLAAGAGGGVAGEFSGYGVWKYQPASGWQQLTRSDASLLVMDAQGDVTGEFNGYGVWQFVPSSGWKQLTASDATLLVAGSGGTVGGEFRGYGIWLYQPAAGWHQLNTVDATRLAVDMNGDTLGEFPAYGVWEYDPARGWFQVSASDALLLAAI